MAGLKRLTAIGDDSEDRKTLPSVPSPSSADRSSTSSGYKTFKSTDPGRHCHGDDIDVVVYPRCTSEARIRREVRVRE